MSKPRKTTTPIIAEPVAVEVEHEVPIVADDDLKTPQRFIPFFEQALAKQKAIDVGDRCFARPMEPPQEAALVALPRSQLLFVNGGSIRPAERWLPVAMLLPSQLNGWDYLRAQKLYVEPIFAALESLFDRASAWRISGCAGEEDAAARRMTGVEKVEIDAMVEIDNGGNLSGSRTQFILYRKVWLPLRRLGRLQFRQEQPQRTYPDISIV